MKTFVNLAKKAFKEGSNNAGEKITGYVSSKLEKCSFQNNHYTITLKLVQPNGHKCNTEIGFTLYPLRKHEDNAWFAEKHKCEPSPYRYYLNVVSGGVVFTVPVTEDMLDAFPMSLNKKSLDQYTWQELEERVYTLKKQELERMSRDAYADIRQHAIKIGLDAYTKLNINIDFVEPEKELPF
jgi:hypothetical protein